MKVIAQLFQDDDTYILRFDPGEDFLTVFSGFLTENKISAATFTAIGTTIKLELGYYQRSAKKYDHHKIDEDLEIVSLIGNVSTMEGKPAVHMHGSFSKSDLGLIGGHVFDFTIAATCELHLTAFPTKMQRVSNSEMNLNLLD